MAKQTQKPPPGRRPPPPPPARRPAPPPQRPASPPPARQAAAQPSRPAAPPPRQNPPPLQHGGNGRAVTQAQARQLPAEMLEELEQQANAGLSKDAADNLIPLIYVLQSLSPQVNPRNPDYVEGAQPGMLWLRGVGVFDGESEGLEMQPCHFGQVVNEWIPRDQGGGFVARHLERPEDAERVTDPQNPKRIGWRSRRGTQYVDTREHVVRVRIPGEPERWMPFVLPFSSTGHTVSRGWMTMMNAELLPSGNSAPSYACSYRVRTKFTKNAAGEWFKLEIDPLGFLDPQQIREGKKIHDAFAAGEKQVDAGGYADDAVGDDVGDGSGQLWDDQGGEGADERP